MPWFVRVKSARSRGYAGTRQRGAQATAGTAGGPFAEPSRPTTVLAPAPSAPFQLSFVTLGFEPVMRWSRVGGGTRSVHLAGRTSTQSAAPRPWVRSDNRPGRENPRSAF